MHSFGFQLQSWPVGIVKYYMYETHPLHFRIAIYFHSNSHPHFTTLPHIFHHLHRLHHRIPLSSLLAPRIKPITYRAITFISGRQSCHQGAEFDTLTLDVYVYR